MRLTEEELGFVMEELAVPGPVRLGALNTYRDARRHFKKSKRDCRSIHIALADLQTLDEVRIIEGKT